MCAALARNGCVLHPPCPPASPLAALLGSARALRVLPAEPGVAVAPPRLKPLAPGVALLPGGAVAGVQAPGVAAGLAAPPRAGAGVDAAAAFLAGPAELGGACASRSRRTHDMRAGQRRA